MGLKTIRTEADLYSGNVATKKKSSIKNVCIGAFLLRLVILIIVLTVGQLVAEPYFLEDDIKYEELAKSYMNMASSPIDPVAFKAIGASGYLTVFWPWVACVSAFIFRTHFAGRIVNIILSTLCVKLLYDLTLQISKREKTALRAAKLFAFLPITVLTSCFNIKDIFLTFGVFYLFLLLIKFNAKAPIKLWQILLAFPIAYAVYHTRGAVIEMLLLFFVVFLYKRLIVERRYLPLALCSVAVVLAGAFLVEDIVGSFMLKLEDYSGYADLGEGIQFVKINSVWDIYKLPFSYFWATLQPIRLQWFAQSTTQFWYVLMCYLNVSIFPIAIGNFLYIFSKKKDVLFWLTSFVMYAAVISLSIGIFRHYLFLLPLQLVHFSLYTEDANGDKKMLLLGGSVAVFLVIIARSIFTMI